MKKQYLLIAFLFLFCAGVAADDVRKPEMQIADNAFFDPTRKQKEESYRFGVEYRLEVGYAQHDQRTKNLSYPNMYLHGVRVGATFTFLLPIHFSLQTGLLYTLTYGKNEQHWRSQDAQTVQTEYIRHRVLEHYLTVPVRVYYTIPLWRKLNLFFYTGPQLHIGLAANDYMQTHLSDGAKAWMESQGVHTSPYDRFSDELVRANIQWGLGGGLEWDRYRLQSGYDFGLNNLVRQNDNIYRHMWEWGWFVSFSYKF
jgi:opacity protein-like surface antigen